MNLETALYYTLSTVVQGGATAIAFVGAFLLYRFEVAERRIDGHYAALVDLADKVGGKPERYSQVALRQIKPLATDAAKAIPENTGAVDERVRQVAVEEHQVLTLRKGFRGLLVLTAIVLCASAALLATTQLYSRIEALAWVVLAASAGGFVAQIIWSVCILKKSI